MSFRDNPERPTGGAQEDREYREYLGEITRPQRISLRVQRLSQATLDEADNIKRNWCWRHKCWHGQCDCRDKGMEILEEMEHEEE